MMQRNKTKDARVLPASADLRPLQALKVSILILLLLLLLPTSAFAHFSDVPKDAWYAEAVETAQASGLITGDAGSFRPNDSITGAEAITIAARLTDIGEQANAEGPWYARYLEHGRERNLFGEEVDAMLKRPVTRAELVHLWSKTRSDLKVQNEIKGLPDITGSTPYAQDIRSFFAAGILSGADEIGRFYPDQTVTRAEAAKILLTLTAPERRVKDKIYGSLIFTSDQALWLENVEVYGLYTINGEYYLPLDFLLLYGGAFYGADDSSDILKLYFTLQTKAGADLYSSAAIPSYVRKPPAGKYIGIAEPCNKLIQTPHIPPQLIADALLCLDGRFPMVKLTALTSFLQVDIQEEGVFLRNKYGDKPLRQHLPIRERDLVGEFLNQMSEPTLRSIHDAIVNHMEYAQMTGDPSYLHPNPAAWNQGHGVCHNYAMLFQEMCIRSGVPCYVQFGDAGEAHAWNVVYTDGQWKHVDVTWDDPIYVKPILLWDYFLVDSEALVKTHSWEGSDYPGR